MAHESAKCSFRGTNIDLLLLMCLEFFDFGIYAKIVSTRMSWVRLCIPPCFALPFCCMQSKDLGVCVVHCACLWR
jgi:hypothetical protein